MNLTLVVLAAGIGSRYGGLKQMDPVGPSGEFIIDYSIHDAVLAGFDRIVFIIRRDIEHDFRSTIGARAEERVQTDYVFQELDILPHGYVVPSDRKKPWGTGHAVMVCENAVKGPFCVINADDFYGRESYQVLAHYLGDTSGDDRKYAMVGFILRNTLSDHGSVARGVCQANANGNLESVLECTKIEKTANGASCDTAGIQLSGNEIVSMNMWGFKPSIFGYLRQEFGNFLKTAIGNPKAEFFIPDVVNKLMKKGNVTVKVLETKSTWFGITYPQDKKTVVENVRKLVKSGIYPADLLSLH
jgi:dTDP-glucose pyrophosphorylase